MGSQLYGLHFLHAVVQLGALYGLRWWTVRYGHTHQVRYPVPIKRRGLPMDVDYLPRCNSSEDSAPKIHVLVQLMWWSCSHAHCARAEAEKSIFSTALQFSDIWVLTALPVSLTYLASQSHLIHNIELCTITFGWERVSFWVFCGLEHQYLSHYFQDTLDIWNGDTGSRIILFLSILPRWWALRKEEVLWVTIQYRPHATWSVPAVGILC